MERVEDWTTPGAYEVVAGVHRIPLPLPQDGLRAVNVYALESSDGVVLVDGGWALAESRSQLAGAFAMFGRCLDEISHVLVTHVHRDHYTQAVALRREFGCQVSLGRGERPTLEAINDSDVDVMSSQADQVLAAGAEPMRQPILEILSGAELDLVNSEFPDVWLDGRTVLRVGDLELVALPTPGHTQGHYVFVDEHRGLLFAGDHVLPHITPSIGYESVPGELPLDDYLRSLRLVRDRPDAWLLPAHGFVGHSVHARVEELLTHHDRRLAACLQAVEDGAWTAYGVASRLTWTRHERPLTCLDTLNQMLAIIETMAHLEVLALRNSVQRADSNGVVQYTSRPRFVPTSP